MKICLVHNQYGKFSGEEAVVASQVALLEEHGHQVCQFTRSGEEIDHKFLGKLQAFFSGIYNPFSVKAFRRFLQNHQPDLVHIHNLYPLISPAVLHVCREFNLPVVMTVHNYRLICPNGLFMVNGKICEKCRGGKEYWCVIKNCEGQFLKSLGYALRNFVARARKSYLDNVHVFAALTDFQCQVLIQEGYPDKRIFVIPNMSQPTRQITSHRAGNYVGYIGRVSQEKGVDLLIDIANQFPSIPFQAAGALDKAQQLINAAPANFQFLGHLARDVVNSFLIQSRIIVLCSRCYEGFPIILVEAMLQGKPVVAVRLGGIPEIVEHGVTGLLFEAGNPDDLAEKIEYLWERPELCRKMGEAGRKKALREYSPEAYYQRLMQAYSKAREICANDAL